MESDFSNQQRLGKLYSVENAGWGDNAPRMQVIG
jgi:hypothetical protein